jgi:hypothetical protein
MALRGFVATIDSLLALGIAGLTILAVVSQAPVLVHGRNAEAYTLSADFLEYAYQSGTLESAVYRDTQKVRRDLALLPARYCAALSIYDDASTKLISISRPCPGAGRQKASASKPFVLGGRFYVAQLEGWYD